MVIFGVTIENYVKSCENYRQLRELLALRGFVKKDIGVLNQSKSPGRIAI